jgi:DNA-binding response OmpR family regulator
MIIRSIRKSFSEYYNAWERVDIAADGQEAVDRESTQTYNVVLIDI